ncbi:Fc.00g073610.m01.CDS01 [Cosmosporella sp. VM-42]
MAEANTSKAERVIVRACDMCRRKKIRCEPTAEGCAQCTKYKSHCHFTPITMKRNSRKPAGFKYIMQLEERLKNMEMLLDNELKNKGSDGSDSSRDEYAPFGVLDLQTDDQQTSHGVRNLAPGPLGHETGFVDSAFVTTLPLSVQLQNYNDVSGKVTLNREPFLSSLQPSPYRNGSLTLGRFSLPSFHEMPGKLVALELVKDAFASFNSFFPLFDEQDFLNQFENHYLSSSPSNPGWWACINVVLSLAHRFRAMRSLETGYENAESCGYIHNALAVVSELNILDHSLPAVQALVGMAIILQGTPNPHSASVLVAAAVRLAQTMGLQRSTQDPSLTNAEIEQRRRVFWIAYVLDKDISLRMGLPFAQDDDDMDAELPTGTLSEQPVLREGPCNMNAFKSRIGLAVIQGQIYKSLYSVQAARQSGPRRAAIAQELNSILSYWRSGVLIDFEDNPVTRFQGSVTLEFIHTLILRFTYINCLVMIDRHLSPTHQPPYDSGPEAQGEIIPESICIIESRKAIQLIQMTPHGDYACVW